MTSVALCEHGLFTRKRHRVHFNLIEHNQFMTESASTVHKSQGLSWF